MILSLQQARHIYSSVVHVPSLYRSFHIGYTALHNFGAALTLSAFLSTSFKLA